MSMTLERRRTRAAPTVETQPADRLRHTMTGVRLSFSWFGLRRSLTPGQKSQAAEALDAAGDVLAASKKLLDTKHPAFQAVAAVKHQATSYWKAITLPFPEPGLRLIRQADIEPFHAKLTELSSELADAVTELDRAYPELQAAAAERLGQLYQPTDYPRSLRDEFALMWEFPAVEPPEYLRRLSPELYERECQRVTAQFNEAVALAEQAFCEEFGGLVSHLTERLAGDAEGQPKVFRDSAVTNLRTFFDRFRTLNVGSNAELESLVDQAQQLLRGVAPQDLRASDALRSRITQQLGEVQTALEPFLVDRPRRNILRRPR